MVHELDRKNILAFSLVAIGIFFDLLNRILAGHRLIITLIINTDDV